MLLAVHTISDGMRDWAEACPCHAWRADNTEQSSAFVAALAKVYGASNTPCIMNGRRAVELANGMFLKFFKALADVSGMDMLDSLPTLEPHDKALILADFESARAFILFELRTRLGFWHQLPWVFAAFADWDEDRSRSAARKAVHDFDVSAQDPQQHHRLTWDWLAPGSEKREALNSFIDGAPLDSIPMLCLAVAELAFISVVEREQEGQHSIVKRATSYRGVSAPFVSLQIRGRFAARFVAQDPKRFEAMLSKTKTAKQVVKWLGLHHHPLWKSLLAKQALGHKVNWIQALCCIIYSMSPQERYWRNVASKRVQALARRARANHLKKTRAQIVGKMELSKASSRTVALQEHLREVMVPDEYYSLPRSVAVFHGLSDALGPLRRPADQPLRARRVMAADAHSTVDTPRSDAGEQVFFQLVRLRPSRGKHVHGAFATNAWFEQGDIAITFHRGCKADGQWLMDSRPLIEHGASSSLAILRFRPEHLQSMESSLVCHERERRLSFSLFNLQTELIQDLVKSSAWPASPHSFQLAITDDRMDELKDLEQKGLVHNVGSHGSFSKWKFTELATSNLHPREHAGPPQVLLQRRRTLFELGDASRYELLVYLDESGFTWRAAPRTTAARLALPPFEPDSAEKLFYCTGVEWDKRYAMCLLQAERLFNGGVKMIKHGGPSSYYKSVWDLKTDGCQALEDAPRPHKRRRLQADSMPMPLEDQVLPLEDLPQPVLPPGEPAAPTPPPDEPGSDEEAGDVSSDNDSCVQCFSTDESDNDDVVCPGGPGGVDAGDSPAIRLDPVGGIVTPRDDGTGSEGGGGGDGGGSNDGSAGGDSTSGPVRPGADGGAGVGSGGGDGLANEPTPPPPPPIPPPAQRLIHWHGFNISWAPGGAMGYGKYIAVCKYHLRYTGSACARERAILGPTLEDRNDKLREMRQWCLNSIFYSHQRDHIKDEITIELILPFEIQDEEGAK